MAAEQRLYAWVLVRVGHIDPGEAMRRAVARFHYDPMSERGLMTHAGSWQIALCDQFGDHCHDPAGAIAAVRRRSQTADEQSRSRIAEARHGSAPIRFVSKSGAFLTRHLFAPLHQTRTSTAGDHLRLQLSQSISRHAVFSRCRRIVCRGTNSEGPRPTYSFWAASSANRRNEA